MNQSATLTLEERIELYNYIYQERLALLCADNPPSAEHDRIAAQDAEEAFERSKDFQIPTA